jgi:hypothetical protein
VDHPVTGERLELFEPLPADLVGVLERAGLTPPAEDELASDW